MFTDANKQSLSQAFTCVNRINAAFRNVNTSPPNVGGDVSKTSQVQSTYCAFIQLRRKGDTAANRDMQWGLQKVGRIEKRLDWSP